MIIEVLQNSFKINLNYTKLWQRNMSNLMYVESYFREIYPCVTKSNFHDDVNIFNNVGNAETCLVPFFRIKCQILTQFGKQQNSPC